MVRFFSRPAVPHPDDLCLVHSPLVGPPEFRPSSEGWWTPRKEISLEPTASLFLGETEDGRAVWALEVPPPDAETWTGLRTLMGEGPLDQVRAAVRTTELAAWRRDHRFCGACGTPTRRREHQVAFECPRCGAEFWPRVTPAVIMLVHRGDEVLLARHTRHSRPGSPPPYTTLAGFVEAGETLEEAVAREVAEEVGVVVGAPVYIGSQAWPFPHSLMVGFHVPWVSGEPVPDGQEIAEAGWYRRDHLPNLPGPQSIARRLIRTFFDDPTI